MLLYRALKQTTTITSAANIETINAAIKRKLAETLKSKNPTAQINELLAKIVAYNLTVVIHEMYKNEIKLDFLQQKS